MNEAEKLQNGLSLLASFKRAYLRVLVSKQDKGFYSARVVGVAKGKPVCSFGFFLAATPEELRRKVGNYLTFGLKIYSQKERWILEQIERQ